MKKIPKLAPLLAFLNMSQKMRLLNLRLKYEKQGQSVDNVSVLNWFRFKSQTDGRQSFLNARQYWFGVGADAYDHRERATTSSERVDLDRLSAAGFDALIVAEQEWRADPPKVLERFIGGFWLGQTARLSRRSVQNRQRRIA